MNHSKQTVQSCRDRVPQLRLRPRSPFLSYFFFNTPASFDNSNYYLLARKLQALLFIGDRGKARYNVKNRILSQSNQRDRRSKENLKPSLHRPMTYHGHCILRPLSVASGDVGKCYFKRDDGMELSRWSRLQVDRAPIRIRIVEMCSSEAVLPEESFLAVRPVREGSIGERM